MEETKQEQECQPGLGCLGWGAKGLASGSWPRAHIAFPESKRFALLPLHAHLNAQPARLCRRPPPAGFRAVQVYTPPSWVPALSTTREHSFSSYTKLTWLLSVNSPLSCRGGRGFTAQAWLYGPPRSTSISMPDTQSHPHRGPRNSSAPKPQYYLCPKGFAHSPGSLAPFSTLNQLHFYLPLIALCLPVSPLVPETCTSITWNSGSHSLLLATPLRTPLQVPLLLRWPRLLLYRNLSSLTCRLPAGPMLGSPPNPCRGLCHPLTLYHMMSGNGFPSTTTAKRAVSPASTSTSSMMDSNRGASETHSPG